MSLPQSTQTGIAQKVQTFFPRVVQNTGSSTCLICKSIACKQVRLRAFQSLKMVCAVLDLSNSTHGNPALQACHAEGQWRSSSRRIHSRHRPKGMPLDAKHYPGHHQSHHAVCDHHCKTPLSPEDMVHLPVEEIIFWCRCFKQWLERWPLLQNRA